MTKEELLNRFKKIPVQSAEELVEEKSTETEAALPPRHTPVVKVSEEELQLASIKSLSSQIDKADISVRAVRKKKDNLNLTEKSELQLERAILVADATKQSKRQAVVAQRVIEELFMLGERLKYLAFTGDKAAIKMMEDMREAGIVDEYIYKKK